MPLELWTNDTVADCRQALRKSKLDRHCRQLSGSRTTSRVLNSVNLKAAKKLTNFQNYLNFSTFFDFSDRLAPCLRCTISDLSQIARLSAAVSQIERLTN